MSQIYTTFRKASVTGLLASCAFPLTLYAQGVPEGETQLDPDELGVNLSTGSMYFPSVELSIGNPEEGGLTYRRSSSVGVLPSPHVSTDNFQYEIVDTTFFDVWSGILACSVNVTIGAAARDFNSDCGSPVPTFTPEEQDGVSLVAVPAAGGQLDFVYTDRDGTVTTFKNLRGHEIIKPNGEKTKFHYTSLCPDGGSGCVNRLISVTNNSGYQLWFEHTPASAHAGTVISSGKITALNNALEACAVTLPSCSPSGSWPSLTFSSTWTNNMGSLAEGVTDSAGNIYGYISDYSKIPSSNHFNKSGSYSKNGVTLLSFVMGAKDCCSDEHAISSVTNPAGTWSYAWPYAVSEPTRTDPLGNVRAITAYKGRVLKFKNELGAVWRNFFDVDGNLLKAATPQTTYDGSGQPLDAYTQYTYDGRGNRLSSTWIPKAGSGLGNISTSSGYDATCGNPKTCNQPNWTRDALGNQTDYTYDAVHGGLLTMTRPAPAPGGLRPQIRYAYSPLEAYYKNGGGVIMASGAPIYKLSSTSTCLTSSSCLGQADESKVTLGYGPQSAGAANNLQTVSTTRSSGDGAIASTVTKSYDNIGNIVSVDGPSSGAADTTVYRYDTLRRLIGEVGPDPDGSGPLMPMARKVQYDSLGYESVEQIGTVPDQSTEQWGSFTEAYRRSSINDSLGRSVRNTVQAGGTDFGVVDQFYGLSGEVTCKIVRMDPGSWSTAASGCAPQQTSSSNGPDRVTKYTRDAAGQVIQTHRGYGTASIATETSGYTPTGKVAFVVDAQNNRTTYEYDGFDRPSKTFYPVATPGSNASSVSDYEQVTYGDGVHVTAKRLRDGSITAMTYDNLGRLASLAPQGEPAATYTYNLADQPLTISNGTSLSRTYDALGRLTSEAQAAGSVAYQYDAADRLTKLVWSDGFFINYDYNSAGWTTAIRENGTTSGIGVLATYSYDSLGRRDQVWFGNGTSRKYEFDGLGRLKGMRLDLAGTANDLLLGGVSGAGVPFNYNPASQMTSSTRSNDAYAFGGRYNVSRSYTPDGLNRYSAAGAVSFGYDARGNLTASGTTAFGYNRLNQLTSGPNGTVLSYDAVGRLATYVAGGATRFYYSGPMLIAEVAGASSTILRRYVPGPGVDEPVVWYEGSGTSDRRFLQADERGSIIVTSDTAGAALAVNSYDEYGIPQGSNLGRFQYTGQTWLPELGLYNFKARMYSPTLGRFVQTDPIGYKDGINWYNYVGGDPINHADASGLGVGCTADGSLCEDDGRPDDVVTGSRPYSGGGVSLMNALPRHVDWQWLHWVLANAKGPPKVEERQKPQNGPCGSHPILGGLGKLWSSPNSALGLLAAGGSYVAGKVEGTNPSFQIGNNSIQLLNSPLNVNNRAYTLGNVQVYGVGDGPSRGQISYTGAFVNTGMHEEGHTVQGQILGPLYLPAWGLGRLFGGDSAGNPMEAGADKYAQGKSCSGF